jgi:5'(3')-deoxyribonucleotidase
MSLIQKDVFVDSDGVVVDFEGHVFDIFDKKMEDFNPKSRFWSSVIWHDTHVAKFFRNMPKMRDADQLIEYLVARYRSVKILTAGGFTPKDVAQQKIDWYAEHYPNLECIVVNKSPDKAKYAAPDAILIDDRTKSTYPFEQAGGIAVLHKNTKDTIRQLEALEANVA